MVRLNAGMPERAFPRECFLGESTQKSVISEFRCAQRTREQRTVNREQLGSPGGGRW